MVLRMYWRISLATDCNSSIRSRRRSSGELIVSSRLIAADCNARGRNYAPHRCARYELNLTKVTRQQLKCQPTNKGSADWSASVSLALSAKREASIAKGQPGRLRSSKPRRKVSSLRRKVICTARRSESQANFPRENGESVAVAPDGRAERRLILPPLTASRIPPDRQCPSGAAAPHREKRGSAGWRDHRP